MESVKLIWALKLLDYPENFFGYPKIDSKVGFEAFLGYSKHTGNLRRFMNYLEVEGVLDFIRLRDNSDVKLFRINKAKLWVLVSNLETFRLVRKARNPSDL